MDNSLNKTQQNDELNLGRFVKEVYSKWYYFLISGIIITLLAVVYIELTLPVYQTIGSVLIDDSKSSPKNIEDFISTDIMGSSMSLETEVGILKSRSVITSTIDQLELRVQYWNSTSYPYKPIYPKAKLPFIVKFDTLSPYLQEAEFNLEVLDSNNFELTLEYSGDDLPAFTIDKKAKFGDRITSRYFNFVINKNDTHAFPPKGQEYVFKKRSINKLASDMQLNLDVEPFDKDANIITLTYNDVVPLRAIDVLNTIAKVYIDLDIQDKASVAALTLKFVDEQLSSTGVVLSATEKDMQKFKEQNKTIDLSEESKVMLQKMNDVDIEREKNNIELTSLGNLYDYVVKNDDLTNMAPSSLGVPDPLLIELITNFQNLQAKRKSISYGVKKDAPAVKVLDEQIAETRASLLENIRSIRNRMQVTSKALEAQLSQFESSIKGVPDKERQLIGLQRNFEVNQNIYTYLLQKKAETSIAKATVISDNKVLDVAALADDPISPNKKIIVVIIALLSGVIPIGIIIVQNILRSKVKSKDDISATTTIPMIGVVGHSSDDSNLAVHHRPKSAIAEGFRTIRTNLQFYGMNSQSKVIMITSSVGGEGKSFVTINLATVLAMQQNKVIVVGMDLRKPKLFQDFNLKNDIGASNYLVGNASIDQIIRPTTIPFLDIISAGPIPPNPAELLSRKSMQVLIEELKSRYDFIVIDTPPLGIVSDAFLLMPVADITLYIVRQGFSKLEYLRSLDDLHVEGKVKNVSIVLNDSVFSKNAGYGHNYGYVNSGSGYYEEDNNQNGIAKKFRRKKKDNTLN